MTTWRQQRPRHLGILVCMFQVHPLIFEYMKILISRKMQSLPLLRNIVTFEEKQTLEATGETSALLLEIVLAVWGVEA